jgi:hypothetical protein
VIRLTTLPTSAAELELPVLDDPGYDGAGHDIKTTNPPSAQAACHGQPQHQATTQRPAPARRMRLGHSGPALKTLRHSTVAARRISNIVPQHYSSLTIST